MRLAKWRRGGTDYRPRPLLIEIAGGYLDEWTFLLRWWLGLG